MKYALAAIIWLIFGLASDLAYIGEANRQCGYYPRARGIFAMLIGGPLLAWAPILEIKIECAKIRPET